MDRTLEMARDAGLGWVKQHFPWEDIELKKGTFWNDQLNKSTWEKYDRIVALAQKYHLRIIARLDRPPDWTRKDNSRKEAPPDNFQDYADFVEAVARRYKGKIQYYQLWNEPNIWPEWGNKPIDPAAYVNLLRVGYEAIKRADPDAYVLSAPLAQTTENSPRAMEDLRYLEGMYKSGAKNYFDVFLANAYGFSSPPDDPPDPNVLNFQRVLLLRDIMVRNGDGDKPVWFNEFGWTAPPAGFPPDKLIWGSVTEQQQAEYTVAAIDKARAEWPWAGVFSIWYFRQDGHIPSDRADYYFRMVDVGFTPRPLYQAVKAKATSQLRAMSAGDYQETNPAVVINGNWHYKRDARASGQGFLESCSPGDDLTITFRGTDLSLLLRKGPDAGLLYASVDGGLIGKLPRDPQGRSYVDLYDSTEQWQSRAVVAEGLSNGEHKLRLVVGTDPRPAVSANTSASGQCAAGGNLVVFDGFSVRDTPDWSLSVLLAVAGLLIVGILLLRWRRRSNRQKPAMPPENS